MSDAAPQRRLTRRRLLGAGAGALAGAGGLRPSDARAALAATPATVRAADGDHLARILMVQQLSAYIYDHVFAQRILPAGQQRALAPLGVQEHEHVAALTAAVRARAVAVPSPPGSVDDANLRLRHRQITPRVGQLRGAGDARNLLVDVERATIGSSWVALRSLVEPDAIVLVCRIMANDAQHEALITRQEHPLKLELSDPYGTVSGAH